MVRPPIPLGWSIFGCVGGWGIVFLMATSYLAISPSFPWLAIPFILVGTTCLAILIGQGIKPLFE